MIKHDAVSSLGVSPIRENSKHQINTPLKLRCKTSRKDQGADVHTTCSTPNRLTYGNLCGTSSLNSPSDSFPCSQENRPDVIWDYTSPKLPKGAKKKEIKITVDEFLRNLSHNQNAECNTQNSHYIKLLEKWMAKQNTPVCPKKPIRAVKRDYKMRSRRVFEEIKQFMESIKQNNDEKITENDRAECMSENSLPNVDPCKDQSGSSVNKMSFLEGDSNENDSLEELWGEADNSFIVKATQHLDVSCLKYNAQCKNMEIASTIPETITSTSARSKAIKYETQPAIENDYLNNPVLDSDQQAQILLTQIMSCDWESDSDFEDFEKGFIMGDDALSLIPDDVLSGTSEHGERTNQSDTKNSFSDSTVNNNVLKSSNTENRSCEISFGCSESNNLTSEVNGISEIELFNNFEDESFGDESILCKPEVLSWIDEVESKLSQSQKCSAELSLSTKCTPEEIEKKKDEAMQRRKNLSKKK